MCMLCIRNDVFATHLHVRSPTNGKWIVLTLEYESVGFDCFLYGNTLRASRQTSRLTCHPHTYRGGGEGNQTPQPRADINYRREYWISSQRGTCSSYPFKIFCQNIRHSTHSTIYFLGLWMMMNTFHTSPRFVCSVCADRLATIWKESHLYFMNKILLR